jgi:hypothetical protein
VPVLPSFVSWWLKCIWLVKRVQYLHFKHRMMGKVEKWVILTLQTNCSCL